MGEMREVAETLRKMAKQNHVERVSKTPERIVYAQGGNDTVIGWGAENGIASANIGKFGYSSGDSASASNSGKMQTLNGIPISPMLNGYLWPTGLLYRGVISRG